MRVEYQRPPVRVALMGLGRAMFSSHYPIFKAHPALFRVVAACDLIKERRDIIAKDFPDCKMFRQFGDMLDERDIDLVDIATCSTDHVQHALMSLDKGFWTLLESPMALTVEDARMLRGAAAKAKNRLLVIQRGLFAPDYLLAKSGMGDPRLGDIHQIRIRREDYAHVSLKTRGQISADVEFNGGCLAELRSPSFEICGERGAFSVQPGASEGTLTVVDPDFKFPRRRSSVRTPEIVDLHEQFPVVKIPVSLPKGTMYGPSAFWKHVYDTVRTAAPFPLQLDDSIEAVKFAHLMKKISPFGK